MKQRFSTRYDDETYKWLVTDAFQFGAVVSKHLSKGDAEAEINERNQNWQKFGNAVRPLQQLQRLQGI